MASALKTQLGILMEQQAEHKAQIAKKPNLVLYVGGVPSPKPPCRRDFLIEIRQTPPSRMTCSLKMKAALLPPQVLIRVVVLANDVGLQSSPPYQQPIEPPDISYRTFIIPAGLLRPNTVYPMTLTFTFP
jgi:hypothetical protein